MNSEPHIVSRPAVPRPLPETIWAVKGAPTEYRATFYTTEHVILGARFVPKEVWRPFIEKVATHFMEYPGMLTLVGMSELEKQQADAYDLRMHGRDRVIFSWRRLPGVLD